MADRKAAGPRVLVLGWLTDLSGSIAAALERGGITAKHAHPPGTHLPIRSRWLTAGPEELSLSAAEIDSIDSVIAILEGPTMRIRFGGRHNWASRRQLRRYANEACASTTRAALTVGARRTLLICDARRLPPGRRAIALRWTRDLAYRIGYECVVNGLPGHAASYAVIDTDDDVRDVADAIVTWQQGTAADDRRRRWPLHPVLGSAEVMPASSRPHRTPPS
ncbi:hypothetical protein AB0876_20270 [Mycobacterium sp. NPDC049093]